MLRLQYLSRKAFRTTKGFCRLVGKRSVSGLPASLSDPGIYRNQALINGEWRNSDSTFAIRDPGTGEVIAEVPEFGKEATEEAIIAANIAFVDSEWSRATAKSRSVLLKKVAQLHHDHLEDLARILTLESGKPLIEAKGEILYGASFFEWFAEEAKRIYGEIIPDPVVGRRTLVLAQPVGVAALITPWNFPNAMIARKAAAAMAAGCTVVVKPAHDTPLSALAIAELMNRAGIPKGVFNVITASKEAANEVGDALLSSQMVRKISFTGSTNVGKMLLKKAADTVKRVSLELGGNAPFIVFDDADVEKAVDGAIASKFRNTGQTCVCANRIYVQEDIYDEFCNVLVNKVQKFQVGHGLTPGVDFGPLINEQAFEKTSGHVEDAVVRGGTILTGGKRIEELPGNFFAPTVIANVNDEMNLAREEVFGPIAPIFKFQNEEEVVRRANHTTSGLASYFYSNDVSRVFRVCEALEYGMVGVNAGMISQESAPFGGIKESGLGREGSRHGIEEYIDLKYVAIALDSN